MLDKTRVLIYNHLFSQHMINKGKFEMGSSTNEEFAAATVRL